MKADKIMTLIIISYLVDNNENMQSGIKQNDDLNTEIYEYEQLADIGDIADIGD